jgi:hypothetical protein
MAYSSNKTPAELSELSALATNDTIIVGDTSDTAEVVKKITAENLYIDIASASMTMTNKILTEPTITLKQSASPTPTAEGDIQWDTDDNKIVVGDGATAKTFVPTSAVSGDATMTTAGVLTVSQLPFSFNLVTGSSSAMNILRYSDKLGTVCGSAQGLFVNIYNTISKYVDLTSYLAAADRADAAVVLGDYLYLLITETSTTPDTKAVYRVNLSDLTTSVVMTFSGATVLTNTDQEMIMTSDGTYFYFSYKAGTTANSYEIAKYSISGTVFTYVSTITLGNTIIYEFVVLGDGTFRAHTNTSTQTELQKYNSSGTSTATYSFFFADVGDELSNINGTLYVTDNSTRTITKVYLP